jgi:hypothetical protein
MDDIGNLSICEGMHIVTIIVGGKVIDNDTLSWHKKGSEERHITLKEIYEQFSKQGSEDVIYVMEEAPLRGMIYQCGNHEQGLWEEHGTTKGYA